MKKRCATIKKRRNNPIAGGLPSHPRTRLVGAHTLAENSVQKLPRHVCCTNNVRGAARDGTSCNITMATSFPLSIPETITPSPTATTRRPADAPNPVFMSHAVARRMYEMGVRLALGATQREVMSLVVGRGMRGVLAGAVLGVAGALGLTRLMGTIIYGVRATDLTTFVVVTAFLLAVALVACWIPARHATRIDPLTALRGR